MYIKLVQLLKHRANSLRVFGMRSPVVTVTLPGSVHNDRDDGKYLLMASRYSSHQFQIGSLTIAKLTPHQQRKSQHPIRYKTAPCPHCPFQILKITSV